MASFTDRVPYRISVTDPEDGSTGAGIDCANVQVTVSLGHDTHAHGLSQTTGCTGTFSTGLTAGHGSEANTFTVLGVAYTDKGGPGGIAPLTGRAQAILQPKTKQAEFFASTGRLPNTATTSAAGASTENTTDTLGGGSEPDRARGRRLRLLQAGQPQEHLGAALPRGERGQHRLDPDPPGTPPPARSWPRPARSARRAPARPTRPSGCRSRLQDRRARAVPRVPQPGRERLIAEPQPVRVRRPGRRRHGAAHGLP